MLLNKHGSFYVRNGWPTKMIGAICADEHIFSPNNELDAVDEIGVGRVMVKSMRYWAVMLGIAQEQKTRQGIEVTLTEFGELVARMDLYCDDIGTLWLMHRNLVGNMESATAWAWAFNVSQAHSFTKNEFSTSLYTYIQKNGGSYARKAVEKEFDCFKNTYVSDKSFDVAKIIEENTIPFFAPLQLITYKGEGRFQKSKIASNQIPLEILLYCLISDNEEHLETNAQLSIDKLLEDEYQIGRYMNLSYATLLELLQQLENKNYLKVFNNFGSRYIELGQINKVELLEMYYQKMEG